MRIFFILFKLNFTTSWPTWNLSLSFLTSIIIPAVGKNDLPIMIGIDIFSSISNITKFTGMINFCTLINTFSNTPNRYLIDLSANCKVILVRLNSCKPNCLATIKRINDTFAPKSYNILKISMLPIVHGIEKLPESFNFGGSLFCMMALHSFVILLFRSLPISSF